MDPSSLIFVVIVAIWAAYLLGHWVRRRDQLATARSIDRFSQAMRVLERRTPVAVPLSRPRPRAYVVAPARGAQLSEPQVVAKRTPAVARPSASRPVATSDARTSGGGVRAVVLLALVVLAPAAWVLTGLAVAPWWAATLLSLALVGQVVLLRRAAARRRELARRRARLQRRATSQARRQSTRDVVDEVLAARRPASATIQEPAGAVDGVEPQVAAAVEEGRPSNGWSPVPVPPPTYTLKPKAPPMVARPAPAPAQPAQPTQPTPTAAPAAPEPAVAPAATAPTFDLDEILERRIASGG